MGDDSNTLSNSLRGGQWLRQIPVGDALYLEGPEDPDVLADEVDYFCRIEDSEVMATAMRQFRRLSKQAQFVFLQKFRRELPGALSRSKSHWLKAFMGAAYTLFEGTTPYDVTCLKKLASLVVEIAIKPDKLAIGENWGDRSCQLIRVIQYYMLTNDRRSGSGGPNFADELKEIFLRVWNAGVPGPAPVARFANMALLGRASVGPAADGQMAPIHEIIPELIGPLPPPPGATGAAALMASNSPASLARGRGVYVSGTTADAEEAEEDDENWTPFQRTEVHLQREVSRWVERELDQSSDEQAARAAFDQQVHTIIWHCLGCQCHQYGSGFTGLKLRDSDSDFGVRVHDFIKGHYHERVKGDESSMETSPNVSAETTWGELQGRRSADVLAVIIARYAYRRALRHNLVKNRDQLGVELRDRAKKPLIRFFHHQDPSLSADVVFAESFAGVRNSCLLKHYCEMDDRVAPLVGIVKYWSKQRFINSSFLGFLSSYAYTLTVIDFLQRIKPPVLPNIQMPHGGVMADEVLCQDHTFFENRDRHKGKVPYPPWKNWASENTLKVGALLREYFRWMAFRCPWLDAVISPRVAPRMLDKLHLFTANNSVNFSRNLHPIPNQPISVVPPPPGKKSRARSYATSNSSEAFDEIRDPSDTENGSIHSKDHHNKRFTADERSQSPSSLYSRRRRRDSAVSNTKRPDTPSLESSYEIIWPAAEFATSAPPAVVPPPKPHPPPVSSSNEQVEAATTASINPPPASEHGSIVISISSDSSDEGRFFKQHDVADNKLSSDLDNDSSDDHINSYNHESEDDGDDDSSDDLAAPSIHSVGLQARTELSQYDWMYFHPDHTVRTIVQDGGRGFNYNFWKIAIEDPCETERILQPYRFNATEQVIFEYLRGFILLWSSEASLAELMKELMPRNRDQKSQEIVDRAEVAKMQWHRANPPKPVVSGNLVPEADLINHCREAFATNIFKELRKSFLLSPPDVKLIPPGLNTPVDEYWIRNSHVTLAPLAKHWRDVESRFC